MPASTWPHTSPQGRRLGLLWDCHLSLIHTQSTSKSRQFDLHIESALTTPTATDVAQVTHVSSPTIVPELILSTQPHSFQTARVTILNAETVLCHTLSVTSCPPETPEFLPWYMGSGPQLAHRPPCFLPARRLCSWSTPACQLLLRFFEAHSSSQTFPSL